jgi:hypothetical protein
MHTPEYPLHGSFSASPGWKLTEVSDDSTQLWAQGPRQISKTVHFPKQNAFSVASLEAQ